MRAGYGRRAFVGQFLALDTNALLSSAQSAEVVGSLGDDWCSC